MNDSDQPRRSSTIGGAIRRSNSLRVRALGLPRVNFGDIFHQLMRMNWFQISGLFVVCFVAFNLVYAGIFMLDPHGLRSEPGASIAPFWRDFFFSVHTVATIGYGNVYPITTFSNVVVVVEISTGILFFALTTGIVFARFSRPTGRILFSKVVVIRKVDGLSRMMLRVANQRHNLIYSASVEIAVLADEEVGGVKLRRFHDLKLVRERNPVFALTWTVMHVIDEDSPLRDWRVDATPDDAELVIILSGYDESSGQTIYGRWAYGSEDLRWDARFVDIIGLDETGTRTIDYAHFHAIEDAAPVTLADGHEAPH